MTTTNQGETFELGSLFSGNFTTCAIVGWTGEKKDDDVNKTEGPK